MTNINGRTLFFCTIGILLIRSSTQDDYLPMKTPATNLSTSLLFSANFDQPHIANYDIEPPEDSPFHIYTECQPLLEQFRAVAADFTNCTIAYAVPPLLCTSCTELYLDLLNVYQLVMENNTITPLGHPCNQVLTDSYLYSFVEMTFAFDTQLWDISNCNNCISINYDETTGQRNFTYTDSLITYENNLYSFRNCVLSINASFDSSDHPPPGVCEICADYYLKFYDYYWDTFIYPKEPDYCIDIESSMNDTIGLWRIAWQCSDPPKADTYRPPQTAGVMSICVTVMICPMIFYIILYIIGTAELKTLMKYSETADTRTYRTQSQLTGHISVQPTFMNPADLQAMYRGVGQMTPSMSASQRELFVRQQSGDSLDNYREIAAAKKKTKTKLKRKVTRIEERDENEVDADDGSCTSDQTETTDEPGVDAQQTSTAEIADEQEENIDEQTLPSESEEIDIQIDDSEELKPQTDPTPTVPTVNVLEHL